jgi:hypothetical protein
MFDFIVDKINIDYSHRELFTVIEGRTTQIFCTFQQSNKACNKKSNDSQAKSSRQSLNVVVIKNHEGKTPGSVLCGLVYAPGCALLVVFPCLRREENPDGCTRYPENHWNSFFVSPKCSKRMGLTSFPDSSPRGLSLK